MIVEQLIRHFSFRPGESGRPVPLAGNVKSFLRLHADVLKMRADAVSNLDLV